MAAGLAAPEAAAAGRRPESGIAGLVAPGLAVVDKEGTDSTRRCGFLEIPWVTCGGASGVLGGVQVVTVMLGRSCFINDSVVMNPTDAGPFDRLFSVLTVTRVLSIVQKEVMLVRVTLPRFSTFSSS